MSDAVIVVSNNSPPVVLTDNSPTTVISGDTGVVIATPQADPVVSFAGGDSDPTILVTGAPGGGGGAPPAFTIEVADEGSLLGTAGRLNFAGAGVVASLAGSIATITIPGGTVGAISPLTIDSSGTGTASGTVFDGTSSITISYNSVGAQPLDADLTSIAALTTTTFGRNLLTMADAAALTAQGNVFTASLKGLVPLSGGGTTNYLRADGLWATPPFAGSGAITSSGLTMATTRLLGRTSASTGAIEELTAAAVKALLAITTGDVSGLGTVATLASDTDTALAANSDLRIATQKAVKAYIDAAVVGLLDFKGSIACAANPNYPAALKGDAYVVSTAGKIGGASGKSVDIGDAIIASADNAGGTEAAVGTSWFVLEHNLTGALLAANNLSDLANVATARTNLGLAAIAASGSAADLVAGTIPAARMPAYTGDVTSSAGSVALTIANGAVSLAKMANLAANSIIGNNTGTAATPIALTAAQVKTLLAISAADVSGLAAIATSGSGADLGAATVTLAKLATQATGTFLANNSGSTASPTAVTAANATAMLSAMVGANGTVAGTKGLVPAPAAADNVKFLKGNGTWAVLSTGDISGLAAIASSGSANDLSAGTIPAARMPALTGDVTTTAGAVATTIADNAVSLAKMADVATGTVFYRKTAATGDPEVQTLATLKTDLGLTGTNSGDQTITLSGDVSGSGTGAITATIGANKVTRAMLAATSGATLLGATAAGNVADLTAAQAKTFLGINIADVGNMPTGTVLYRKTAGTGAVESQTLATLKTDLALAAIASSGSGADLTANSVTLGKLATQAAATILGNNTAGAAVPSALTAAQTKTLLAIAAQDVSFTQTGTGAVARTVYAKVKDQEASAQDFGAVGNGTTDDKAAIQAALNSGASKIILPSGAAGTVYLVSGTLTIPSQVELVGNSAWGAVIRCNNMSVPIISSNGTSNGAVRSLNLQYSGTPLTGADAISITNCQTWDFTDLWISSSWNGLAFYSGGGNHNINNFRSYSYQQCGLLVSAVVDINLVNFRMHAGDSIKGTLGGIRLQGGAEAFNATNGDITLGKYALTTADFGSQARGSAPYFNRFSNVFFDSAKEQCAYLRSLQHSDFTSCWFASSGHDEAVGYGSAGDFAGADLDLCSHIRFIGGDFYNNGAYGALLYNTNKRILFDGASFKRNGFSRTASRAGVQVNAGTTDFMVRSCLFERDTDTTTYRMDTAVSVVTGASDRYNISDNMLGGTVVTDLGTGTNKRVANNY